MAEKTLNTRIVLRHGTLAAQNASTEILKNGEVALASVTTGNMAVPTFLMKVGDGTKKFSELNWLAAPASDVYAWAKKENLSLDDIPTMDVEHIPNLATSKITGLDDKLAALEAAVGEGGSIDTAITNAINALDVTASVDTDGVVIASIGQVDGKIAVTRRALTAADVPALEISKITGLQAALDAKVSTTTFDTAKAALEQKVTDEATARADADTALQKAIDELEDAIGNVTNLMNFRGAFASKDACSNPVDGDVIVINEGVDNGKEFVYSNGAWVEFGSVDAQQTAIDGLLTRMSAVETKADAAATKTDLTSATETLTGQIETLSGTVIDNKDAVDAKVAELETKDSELDTAVKAAKALADTNAAAIATINGSGDGSIAKALADAKAYADQAEADALAAAKTDAAAKVKALEDGAVATNATNISNLTTRVAAIESDYLKAADTYILDCGEVTVD